MKDSYEFPGTVTAIARSLRLGQGQGRLGADGGAGLGTAGGARLGAAGGAGLGAAGGAGLGATGETEPGALPVLQEPSNSSSNSLVQAMLQQQQQQRIFQEKTFSMISSLLQDKETSIKELQAERAKLLDDARALQERGFGVERQLYQVQNQAEADANDRRDLADEKDDLGHKLAALE